MKQVQTKLRCISSLFVGVHVKRDVLEEIGVADEVGKVTHNVGELEDIGQLKSGTCLCVDDVVKDG